MGNVNGVGTVELKLTPELAEVFGINLSPEYRAAVTADPSRATPFAMVSWSNTHNNQQGCVSVSWIDENGAVQQTSFAANDIFEPGAHEGGVGGDGRGFEISIGGKSAHLWVVASHADGAWHPDQNNTHNVEIGIGRGPECDGVQWLNTGAPSGNEQDPATRGHSEVGGVFLERNEIGAQLAARSSLDTASLDIEGGIEAATPSSAIQVAAAKAAENQIG